MREGEIVADKYRLGHPLGSGGMATVWSAVNVFTDRRVAIKFILPQLARAEEATTRLLREAKISARINHPNVIEVMDLGCDRDGSLFLVMELLNGISLDAAMRRRDPPLGVRDFLWVMTDVARALAATHRCGVIHRDLKPSNVFLHRDRAGNTVPKVLDFGVSKILEPEGGSALTVLGTILGSPFYMSPEQALGTELIDKRTDVFSFGSMLFEGLTGQRAYEAPSFNGLIVAIATTEPKSIDVCAAWAPEPVRALVRECMVTRRARRIDSFESVVARLEPIVDSLDLSSMTLPPQRFQTVSFDSVRRGPSSASAASASARKITSMAPHALPARSAEAPQRESSSSAVRRAVTFAGALGAAAALCTITVSAMSIGNGSASAQAAGKGPSPVSAAQPVAQPASRAPADAVPVVAVDALPAVATRPGRLLVSSAGGSCAISVDGVSWGSTPMSPMSLSPGTHDLACRSSSRTRTARVVVTEGTEASYEFALSP